MKTNVVIPVATVCIEIDKYEAMVRRIANLEVDVANCNAKIIEKDKEIKDLSHQYGRQVLETERYENYVNSSDDRKKDFEEFNRPIPF